jgi:hypothetical protein
MQGAREQRCEAIGDWHGQPNAIQAEKPGQNEYSGDQEEHLPGEHQEHRLFRLPHRLKVAGTGHLEPDQRQSDHGQTHRSAPDPE